MTTLLKHSDGRLVGIEALKPAPVAAIIEYPKIVTGADGKRHTVRNSVEEREVTRSKTQSELRHTSPVSKEPQDISSGLFPSATADASGFENPTS